MKQGLRYLRYSSDGQSNHSIERQNIVTGEWMKHNDVLIADTFIDEGHSAKTFDRPDVKQLFDFIKKNYRTIDYLVVSELTRFSRDLGGAVSVVKKIQSTYGIRIVSAGRSAIYDCTDSTSFFMLALEFLQGNSENIKRENDINGGIYTAKVKEGRYIHNTPPFGYIKEGTGKNSRLVIDDEKAMVIRYIFTSYLKNVPFYIILEESKKLGFSLKGNSSIQKILTNPIYSGQQYVKPWREYIGGIFPAAHEPIIDSFTWNQVQEKFNGKPKQRILITEDLPLRGVLHCHCGKLLTGAPSRNRWGNYYYYYKCRYSKHNNISAIKAHEKLNEALGYMSLTSRLVEAIKESCDKKFEERNKENQKILKGKKNQLEEINNQLNSMEEKYINNKIEFETYSKWFGELTQNRTITKAHLEKLERDTNEIYFLMQSNIEQLTDLQYLYKEFKTTEKQEFIRLVFDNKLYYSNGSYRTPYIIQSLSHNSMILKEKQLLVIEQKRDLFSKVPSGGAAGSRTLVQTYSP